MLKGQHGTHPIKDDFHDIENARGRLLFNVFDNHSTPGPIDGISWPYGKALKQGFHDCHITSGIFVSPSSPCIKIKIKSNDYRTSKRW